MRAVALLPLSATCLAGSLVAFGLSERVQSLQAAVPSRVLDPLGRCGPAEVDFMTSNLNRFWGTGSGGPD